MFAVDQKKGTLRFLGATPTGGKTPRNFNIDPTGSYLIAANLDSDTLVAFRIDPKSGKLTQGATVAALTPSCVKFVKVAAK
jgi:6-phosphogluconolactonase